MLLNNPRQRPGAERRVVAFLGEPRLGRIAELNLDAAVGKLIFQLHDELVDDPCHYLRRQALEADDGVAAITEFGREHAFDGFFVVARALALVTAVAMIPIATAGMAQVDSRVAPEFAKLFATYQRIQASYVDEVDNEKLIRGAIDGMLASLDPHSAYLDGSDLQRLETMIDGNYSGLGLSVVEDDGAVKPCFLWCGVVLNR